MAGGWGCLCSRKQLIKWKKKNRKRKSWPTGRYLTSQQSTVHFLKLTTAPTCAEAGPNGKKTERGRERNEGRAWPTVREKKVSELQRKHTLNVNTFMHKLYLLSVQSSFKTPTLIRNITLIGRKETHLTDERKCVQTFSFFWHKTEKLCRT